MRSTRSSSALSLAQAALVCCCLVTGITCQLPDDIQRELNQNLAEQARIQAMREQHRNQIQSRAGGNQPIAKQQQQQPAAHDPNNYSYQQVSPPIQYSYYQPFGDAAKTNEPPTIAGAQSPQAPVQPMNLDLNDLNFDVPQKPQVAAAASQPSGPPAHLTPSFTGVGGLPIMQPIGGASAASNADSYAPAGNPPLAPQARVQQGPPLSEADFKDITGGENYGAPSGNDFGLGDAANSNGAANRAGNDNGDANTDAQLREFGLPAEQASSRAGGRGGYLPSSSSSGAPQMGAGGGMPDFGGFGADFGAPSAGGGQRARQRADAAGMDFDGLENLAGPVQRGGASGRQDFDFAGEPSSANGDQAAATVAGGAPGSLQSLLGAGFPGLGGGSGGGAGGAGNQNGLDEFASARNNPQQRLDDRTLDIADLGDKSDQFSGADLGGFEQPTARNDQDFNYAAAASQQPSVVPYPDGGPQPVGTLLALTQPQSLTQTRYNALPDKGTYQDYPAYQAAAGGEFGSVSEVVDSTPVARRPAPGRYSNPSARALAPEHRPSEPGQQYDYASGPYNANAAANDEADSSDNYEELDD